MDRTTKEKMEDMQRSIEYLKQKKNDKVAAVQRCMVLVVIMAIIFCVGAVVLAHYRPIQNYYYMHNPSVTIADKVEDEVEEEIEREYR